MKNLFDFDLQLFADDGSGGSDDGVTGSTGAAGGATGDGKTEPGQKTDPAPAGNEPKYTDDDVDRIINRKFAEWEKKQEKKTSEAERLGKMTAEEKAAERMKALEEKIAGYERDAARSEMMKQARTILDGENIHVSDDLLSNIIAEDAESTKSSVESFVKLFRDHVDTAVKNAVKREPPKTGSTSGITKEQIMAIEDRAERQRLINENMSLFQPK